MYWTMDSDFYPMPTRVLAVVVSVCLSVCVSVTRRYCIETAAWIELIFGTQVPSTVDPCYAVFQRN